jgi:hypothetical protein
MGKRLGGVDVAPGKPGTPIRAPPPKPRSTQPAIHNLSIAITPTLPSTSVHCALERFLPRFANILAIWAIVTVVHILTLIDMTTIECNAPHLVVGLAAFCFGTVATHDSYVANMEKLVEDGCRAVLLEMGLFNCLT